MIQQSRLIWRNVEENRVPSSFYCILPSDFSGCKPIRAGSKSTTQNTEKFTSNRNYYRHRNVSKFFSTIFFLNKPALEENCNRPLHSFSKKGNWNKESNVLWQESSHLHSLYGVKKVTMTDSSSLLYYFDFQSNREINVLLTIWTLKNKPLQAYLQKPVQIRRETKITPCRFQAKKVFFSFLLKEYPSKTTSCFILCPEGYPPKPQRMATLLLFSFFSSAFNLAQAASICSFNLC